MSISMSVVQNKVRYLASAHLDQPCGSNAWRQKGKPVFAYFCGIFSSSNRASPWPLQRWNRWHSLATAETYFQLLLASTSTSMWRQPCQVWIPLGHLPMPIKVTQAPHRARNKRCKTMVAETTATPRHRNNDNLASKFERSPSGTDAPLAISSMRHQIDMIFVYLQQLQTIMKKLSATDRMGIIGMDGAWQEQPALSAYSTLFSRITQLSCQRCTD